MSAVNCKIENQERLCRLFDALFLSLSRPLILPLILLLTTSASAQTGDVFPYRNKPIDYFSDETADPVARLRRQLDAAEVSLEFKQGSGYLIDLLKRLDVPISSQMLVFSKTSVNQRVISPENPRALYFNDDIYVGWVPGAAALEISAVAPHKGAIFYMLPQQNERPAKLAREESCLLCHASSHASNVPGHLLRSYLTDPQGNPTQGIPRVTHDTPFAKRWGGWFVTGDVGDLPHLGNLSTSADLLEHQRHPDAAGRRFDSAKRFDASKYPSPHSDVIALMVHDHQTHLHNLITRVNYEHHFAPGATRTEPADNSAITPGEEQLIRYLLFVDATELANPILGSSAFEASFAKRGPFDKQGRSLRQFDLETRLFKYRCSYLIYAKAFEQLPAPVKSRLYRRLWDVLTGRDESEDFQKIPAAERAAIVQILRETKTDLPEYWISK